MFGVGSLEGGQWTESRGGRAGGGLRWRGSWSRRGLHANWSQMACGWAKAICCVALTLTQTSHVFILPVLPVSSNSFGLFPLFQPFDSFLQQQKSFDSLKVFVSHGGNVVIIKSDIYFNLSWTPNDISSLCSSIVQCVECQSMLGIGSIKKEKSYQTKHTFSLKK